MPLSRVWILHVILSDNHHLGLAADRNHLSSFVASGAH
jgi:hypothetical protein